MSQLQVTAEDVVIRDIKTTEGKQLQIAILITSNGHVISATIVGNAIKVLAPVQLTAIKYRYLNYG